MQWNMIYSITLQQTAVNNIGQWLAGVVLFSSLKTGLMLEVSQLLGKVPEFSDWVNITCNTMATCSAQQAMLVYHHGQQL